MTLDKCMGIYLAYLCSICIFFTRHPTYKKREIYQQLSLSVKFTASEFQPDELFEAIFYEGDISGSVHRHHHGSSRTSEHQISGTKARQMCAKYTAQVCNEKESSKRPKRSLSFQHLTDNLHRGHTALNPSIVGGRIARPKEYPHMAQVGFYRNSKIIWVCGGSLISENFVMSAGHCVEYSTPVRIRLGELNWASTRDDAQPVEYKILKVFLHPRYDNLYLSNDIALFEFQGVKKFTDYIRPICLNVLEHIPNQKLIAVGWGKTGYARSVSKELLSVELNLESSANCKTLFSDGRFYGRKMLCAGYTPGGKDTCEGDSGGPLQIFNNEVQCLRIPIYTQVGITSEGSEICGTPHEPAKYTKVSYYIPWIESIVWK